MAKYFFVYGLYRCSIRNVNRKINFIISDEQNLFTFYLRFAAMYCTYFCGNISL